MKTLYIDEVLGFYRKTHANYALLFHIGSNFVAYDNDAVILSKLLSDQIPEYLDNHTQLKFPEHKLEDVIKLFVQQSVPVTWIEYRDDNGNFVLPKVKQILADMEDDY